MIRTSTVERSTFFVNLFGEDPSLGDVYIKDIFFDGDVDSLSICTKTKNDTLISPIKWGKFCHIIIEFGFIHINSLRLNLIDREKPGILQIEKEKCIFDGGWNLILTYDHCYIKNISPGYD